VAARADADGEEFFRASSVPDIASFTIMAWVRPGGSLTGGHASFFNIDWGSGSYVTCLMTSGHLFRLFNSDHGLSGTGSSMTDGTWYHVAMVCPGLGPGGSTQLGYFNGVLDLSHTNMNSNQTEQNIRFLRGNDGDNFNGSIAAIKIWDAALSATEIAVEMRTYTPTRFTNLNSWYPLFKHTDTTNGAPASLALSSSGTLATTDGPAITWEWGVYEDGEAPYTAAAAAGDAVPQVWAQYRPRRAA
jgi:hypothetical protein